MQVLGHIVRDTAVPADKVISNKLGWKQIPSVLPEPLFELEIWINLDYDAVHPFYEIPKIDFGSLKIDIKAEHLKVSEENFPQLL